MMTARHRLIGIGECMVELSGDGNPLFKKAFAGDVLNTLWYAAAGFGNQGDCGFCSAVGEDPLSQQMLRFITTAGIDCTNVRKIGNRRPGLYIIHLTGAERSFSYWRENSAARLLAADRAHLQMAVDSASMLYLSGVTLAILSEDDRNFLLQTMRAARQTGKMVAFDPNIRPALWADEDVMRREIGRAAALSSLVLPSFDDEAHTFGDSEPRETLLRYATDRDKVVVVKDGPGTVLARQAGEMEVFPTPRASKVVDTTGAGDSFNGAFLAHYAMTGDLARAVQAGQKCAAQVIGQPGALVAHDQLKI